MTASMAGDSGSFDVIVLGAGMAGASVAAQLAPQRRVLLLELEDQPGRHTTGRSAAMFFESYGNATVRGLTRASRAFLEQPPEGFADVPLMSPRAALFVAGPQAEPRLQDLLTSFQEGSGLQALPRGQYEAADALGLRYWHKMGFIILPQALRISVGTPEQNDTLLQALQ